MTDSRSIEDLRWYFLESWKTLVKGNEITLSLRRARYGGDIYHCITQLVEEKGSNSLRTVVTSFESHENEGFEQKGVLYRLNLEGLDLKVKEFSDGEKEGEIGKTSSKTNPRTIWAKYRTGAYSPPSTVETPDKIIDTGDMLYLSRINFSAEYPEFVSFRYNEDGTFEPMGATHRRDEEGLTYSYSSEIIKYPASVGTYIGNWTVKDGKMLLTPKQKFVEALGPDIEVLVSLSFDNAKKKILGYSVRRD